MRRGSGARGSGPVRLIHDVKRLAFGNYRREYERNRQIFAGGLPK
jgi:hypothetical protein